MTRRAILVASAMLLSISAVAQDAPVPVGLPADWQARDLEGRWVAYRRAAEPGDDAVQARWYTWLGAQREFELLEWIALYEPRQGTQKVSPLSVLHDVDAPQWLRAAVWIGPRHSDSHQRDKAEELLLLEPDLTLGWLAKHGLLGEPRLAGLIAKARELADPRKDVSAYLGPVEPEPMVLAWLDGPAELPEFGDRLRAEPGIRYVHQVLRAIDGVIVGRLYREPYIGKLARLTQHQNASIRQAALRSLGLLPAALVPYEVLRGLLERSADEVERTELIVALWALGQSDHVEVPHALWSIAADEDRPHVVRFAAAQRLGELADPASVALLMEEGDERVFAAARANGHRRLLDLGHNLPSPPPTTMLWLRRTAWLQVSGRTTLAARAAGLLRESLARDGAITQEQVRVFLEELVRQAAETPKTELDAAVLELARSLLEPR